MRAFALGSTGILQKHHVLLRKTEYYTNTNKRLFAMLYRFRLSRLQNKYCLHVPVNCCRRGFRLMHVGPVLINGGSQVGEDCTFHINTALVAGGTNDAAPILGDHVIVGIGAVVLGGVTIADHVAIGANAVVNKSIEESHIAVAGVPAKKVSDNGSDKWGGRVER